MIGTPGGVTGARVRASVAPRRAATHPRRPSVASPDQEAEEEGGEEGVEAKAVRIADEVARRGRRWRCRPPTSDS